VESLSDDFLGFPKQVNPKSNFFLFLLVVVSDFSLDLRDMSSSGSSLILSLISVDSSDGLNFATGDDYIFPINLGVAKLPFTIPEIEEF